MPELKKGFAMDSKLLSPIKAIGQLLARRINALPFWFGYVLIALAFLAVTAIAIWFFGLRKRVETHPYAKLANLHVNNLWYLPDGTLVATQPSVANLTILTWGSSSLEPSFTTFNTQALAADIASRKAGETVRRLFSDVPNNYSIAVSADGKWIALLGDGYVCVSNGMSEQFINLGDPSISKNDPVGALAFTDAGLLALAHDSGLIEFRDPRNLSAASISTQTKLNRPSVLKPFWNFMVVVSNAAAVVLDMNSLYKEAPPHGYPITGSNRFALAVSKSGRLAVGTGGTTVHLTPRTGVGDASIALSGYGPIKALTFYDEDQVLAAGSFADIYLLSQGEIPERIASAPSGANVLAIYGDKIAYAGDDGIFLVSHTPRRELNTWGKISLAICAVLLLGLVGLLRYDFKRRRDEKEEDREEIRRPIDPQALRLPGEIPQDLIDMCSTGECVLYAGAGLSARSGLPIWKEFVHSLLDWAVQNDFVEESEATSFHAEIETGDADPVADSVISKLKTPEQLSLLNDYLRQVFLRSSSPSAFHFLLKRIKFSAVLTTNFDNLLERNYQVSSEQIYTPKDSDKLLAALTKREYFILKLYGTLDQPETVIVTPAQYESGIAGNKTFSRFMQTLFVSRTLLFVGASLEGIEAYLRGISLPKDVTRMHYALVAVTGNAWRAKADLLERRYGIKVFPYTPGDDHAELGRFLKNLASNVVAQPGVSTGTRQVSSRLKKLTLENIGPFENLELEFDSQMQILLGDNGVGKSTILKAVALALCGDEARDYAGRLLRFGSKHGQIVLETDNKTSYVTEIDRDERSGETEITSNTARPLEAEGWLAIGFPPLRTTSWVPPKGPDADFKFKSIPVADDLLPLITGDVDPRLDKLKQWIVNLDYQSVKTESERKGRPDRYRRLVEKVFAVIATVTEKMTLKYEHVESGTNRIIIKTDDGNLIPLEALSQGTISLVGWIGILMQRLYEVYDRDADPTKRYALILMDEIDAHMHPLWQRTLVNHLKEIFPKAQFIATTHSPLVVSGMPAPQVMRFARNKKGMVTTLPVAPDMTLGYTDQILTSLLFGLPTALDDTTERKMKTYYELYEMKDHGGRHEEFEQLKQELMARVPPPSRSYQEKHDEQLSQADMLKALGEKLREVSPESSNLLLTRASKLRINIEGDKDSDPN